MESAQLDLQNYTSIWTNDSWLGEYSMYENDNVQNLGMYFDSKRYCYSLQCIVGGPGYFLWMSHKGTGLATE